MHNGTPINQHNLISQVAAGGFLMVGDGANRKSMAYVDNVSGFISHLFQGSPGLHIYDYVDKEPRHLGTNHQENPKRQAGFAKPNFTSGRPQLRCRGQEQTNGEHCIPNHGGLSPALASG